MTTDPLVLSLKAALTPALRARDTEAVSALRTALAAIANAEAVALDESVIDADVTVSHHVAGAAHGVGAAEMQRRELAPDDVRRIVEAEVHERLHAADEHDRGGQTAYADRLRREAAVLKGALDASATG